MSNTLSQLLYSPFQDGESGPEIITLHRQGLFADSTRDSGLAINPHGRVTGLQSSKGVYLGREVVGYTWYVGPLLAPSPVFFGDALSDIERFLWDEIDRGARTRPFLVGFEQGAVMALAAAAAVPELISGVIAFDAFFPSVAGWNPPLSPLTNLSILLVNPRAADPTAERVVFGEAMTAQFTDWGGRVTSITASDPTEALIRARDWLAGQAILPQGTAPKTAEK